MEFLLYTTINDPNIIINNKLEEFSTGVKEGQTIRETVDLALKLHKNTKVLNFYLTIVKHLKSLYK